MGKVFKKIAKPISKIIPKEIRPALPFILPFVPVIGPALGGLQSALTSKLAFAGKLAPYLSQGIMAAGTRALTDPNADLKDVLTTGVVAGAPGALSEGLGSLKEAGKLPAFLTKVGEGKDAVSAVDKIRSTLEPTTAIGKASLAATQTGISQAPQMARLQQEEIDRYNQQLIEQGIRDKSSRRQSIFDIYTRSGYDPEYVNSVLDKYGYAEGGRVGYQRGGITLEELLGNTPVYENMGGRTRKSDIDISQFEPIEEIEEEELTQKDLIKDLAKEIRRGRRSDFDAAEGIKGLQSIVDAYEMATGQPLYQRPQPMGIVPGFGNLPRMEKGGMVEDAAYNIWKKMYEKNPDVAMMHERSEEYLKKYQGEAVGKADGGLMNLRAGGMPAEMDMRGGGFIPIGRKERADDVPARLSKNEFVMTADAVRGAGGGSIEKGAKRMYQTMKRLEAKS